MVVKTIGLIIMAITIIDVKKVVVGCPKCNGEAINEDEEACVCSF